MLRDFEFLLEVRKAKRPRYAEQLPNQDLLAMVIVNQVSSVVTRYGGSVWLVKMMYPYGRAEFSSYGTARDVANALRSSDLSKWLNWTLRDELREERCGWSSEQDVEWRHRFVAETS